MLCIVQPLGTVSVEEEVSQIIDDTFSHITAIASGSSSDRRDSPDGGEEETLPFPVPSSADHTSRTEVCGCGCLAWLGLVCGSCIRMYTAYIFYSVCDWSHVRIPTWS